MTYAQYVAALAGLQVAGVVKRFAQPPAQLSTAQLPASWPRVPSGKTSIATLDGSTDLDAWECDLVVAVEAAAQGTQPANWTRAIAVIDALHAALKTEAKRGGVIDKWALSLGADQVGDTVYWLIVATVTGSN